MSSLIATLALISVSLTAGGQPATVRIGLFSLFKPEALQVRVARGRSAVLDSGALGGGKQISVGDTASLRAVGDQINLVITDSYGRVKQTSITRQARFGADPSTSLELILPGRIKRQVRGDLIVRARSGSEHGLLQIVLVADREAAVASVVAAEMDPSLREAEALRALAVIARTFMMAEPHRHPYEDFDFCDTTHCQLYRGEQDLSAEADRPVVARAVSETAGEFLAFADRAVDVHFTAVCGGLSATPEMVWGGTRKGGYAYRRIACSWCKQSHYMNWERRAEVSTVLDALSATLKVRLSNQAEIMVESIEGDQLVRSVMIRDRGRQLAMSTDQFRRAIGRRIGWNKVLSPTFAVERRGHAFIFRGRGFGSQVGFCLVGAVAQAASGRTYREILSFYYPGAEIRMRDEG
jgi:stage II sporulation protein D (peptidoglycan lytic transglycosylase)